MKRIAVVGYMGLDKSCATQAVIDKWEARGVEAILLGVEEAKERGINISNVVTDDLKSMREIDPFMLQMPFTPPVTRRERRKLNRKKK